MRESKQREEERVPARTIVAATRAAGCCGGSLVSVLVATVAEAGVPRASSDTTGMKFLSIC